MRFYLDLTDGRTLIPDEQGVEAQSLDEVCRQAGTAIREMHRTDELGGDGVGWRIIIRDFDGIVHRMIEVDAPPEERTL